MSEGAPGLANGEPLPQSAEAITPELLTRAFAARYPGARADAVEVVDAHSGTTGRARLRVRWAERGESAEGDGAPEAVFAKLAPTDEVQRQMVVMTGMGKRESRFYAELEPRVPVRTATGYASAWNEEGSAYLMLIEDLASSGCSFPSWKDPRLADVAAGMMDSLALLHGAFWESPLFESELAWVDTPMRSDFGPLMVRSAVEQFGADMPPEFHALADIYIERCEEVNDLLDDGPKTLIHGDSHLGNLFLDGDEVGMLDWACVCRAPGLRDVAYFLCNSISSELRRESERELLRRYLKGLAAAGAPAPSEEEAFLRYRRYALCSWVAATVTAAAGSRMQALEIGLRSMGRSTDAIVELGTVDLLREELGG